MKKKKVDPSKEVVKCWIHGEDNESIQWVRSDLTDISYWLLGLGFVYNLDKPPSELTRDTSPALKASRSNNYLHSGRVVFSMPAHCAHVIGWCKTGP